MASIRRTLSPVARPGALSNGEAGNAPSPLSKSSSYNNQSQLTSSGGLLYSLYSSLDLQGLVFGLISQRTSRPLERSKVKGQVWRRVIVYFFICFMVGVFVGLSQYVSMNLSATNRVIERQVLDVEKTYQDKSLRTSGRTHIEIPVLGSEGTNSNDTLESKVKGSKVLDVVSEDKLFNVTIVEDSALFFPKLLIIVTTTHVGPLQAYYLNQLAHTLRTVQPPLLWVVVEMASQSEETADMLRRTGLMYRHLVCKRNLTDVRDRRVHQRNVALSHIESHKLDGIVYFADEENVYSTELFEEMRQIRRFGTWKVAKLTEKKVKATLDGPICNGTQVIGWHVNDLRKRFRRFHAEMAGFAFNSTIIWDQKRWHRPTLEQIRQIDTVNDGFQASAFIEQIVEDESQMEGLLDDCSKIMVWNLPLGSSSSIHPQKWILKNNLDVIAPLA